MRKVMIELLPHKTEKQIDWFKSVNCKVPFIYDGICDYLTIKGIIFTKTSKRIIVSYKDNIQSVHITSLRSGDIRSVVFNDRKKSYEYNKDEFHKGQRLRDGRDILLMKKDVTIYKNKLKVSGYHCRCMHCGGMSFKTLDSLRKGTGCKNRSCQKLSRQIK